MCRCPDGRQGNLCQTGKCYNNPCLGRSVSILRDPSCVDVPTEGKEICVRPVSVITIRVWVAVYRYYGILRVSMSRQKTRKSVSDR